jgi:hypothetical protein
VTRVDPLEHTTRRIQKRGDQGHVAARLESLEPIQDPPQREERSVTLRTRGVERVLHHPGEHRRRDAVSDDIGEEKRDPSSPRVGIGDEVPSQLGARDRAGRERDRSEAGARRREKALLERARLTQLALQSRDVAKIVGFDALQLEAALHEREQHPAIERLLDEVERLAQDRVHVRRVGLALAAGHQDHVEARARGAQPVHEIESGHAGQTDVEERKVGLESQTLGQRLLRGRQRQNVVIGGEHPFDRAQHARLVVDHQDPAPAHDGGPSSSAAGSVTLTSAPSPSALSTLISPPELQTMARHTARPRPLPSSLVVNPGS